RDETPKKHDEQQPSTGDNQVRVRRRHRRPECPRYQNPSPNQKDERSAPRKGLGLVKFSPLTQALAEVVIIKQPLGYPDEFLHLGRSDHQAVTGLEDLGHLLLAYREIRQAILESGEQIVFEHEAIAGPEMI